MKGDIPTYIWKAIPCVTEKAGVVPTLSYALGTYAIQISTKVTVGNIRVILDTMVTFLKVKFWRKRENCYAMRTFPNLFYNKIAYYIHLFVSYPIGNNLSFQWKSPPHNNTLPFSTIDKTNMAALRICEVGTKPVPKDFDILW
jgi:hypothetical protein